MTRRLLIRLRNHRDYHIGVARFVEGLGQKERARPDPRDDRVEAAEREVGCNLSAADAYLTAIEIVHETCRLNPQR